MLWRYQIYVLPSVLWLFSLTEYDSPEHLGKAFPKKAKPLPADLSPGSKTFAWSFSGGKRSFANQPYFVFHSFSKWENLIKFPIFYEWYYGNVIISILLLGACFTGSSTETVFRCGVTEKKKPIWQNFKRSWIGNCRVFHQLIGSCFHFLPSVSLLFLLVSPTCFQIRTCVLAWHG